MKLSRRQAILGALALPLATKASPEYEDGVALFSTAHPSSYTSLAAGADLSPAAIEELEVEIKSFNAIWNARVTAMLAESYRQTAEIIFANTMSEAMPPRRTLLNLARNR